MVVFFGNPLLPVVADIAVATVANSIKLIFKTSVLNSLTWQMMMISRISPKILILE